jgi:hypothetical protein
MARNNKWSKEEMQKMADEIKARRVNDKSFTAKSYAEEKGFVYGTLYQALRRNGMFEPSRKRTPKVEKVEAIAQ